jgi:MFS family permease
MGKVDGRVASLPSEGSSHPGVTLPRGLFVALGLVLFVNMTGLGAVYALLGDLREKHGLDRSSVGLIGGIAFFISVVTQLSVARFADRGHAARMLRAGIVLAAAGLIWFAFATELWQLVLARAAMGMGAGTFSPAARRIVVRSEPSRAGFLLGRLGSVEVAGFVVGPPIAGLIATHTDLVIPFLVPAALLLLALPLFWRIPETVTRASALVPDTPSGLRTLLRLPGVRVALLVMAASSMSVGVFESTISVYLKDIGSSEQATTFVLSAFAVPYVLLSGPGGRLADRGNPYRLAITCTFIAIPVVLCFGVAEAALFVAVVGIIRSCIDAISVPACAVAVARTAPDHMIATGQGALAATNNLGAGIAAMIGAVVYDNSGWGWLWIAASGAMLVFAVGALLTASRAGLLRAPAQTEPATVPA